MDCYSNLHFTIVSMELVLFLKIKELGISVQDFFLAANQIIPAPRLLLKIQYFKLNECPTVSHCALTAL